MAPEEEQVFVAKDPIGVGGACGKALTANMESITFTIDITAANAKDRCGITVVGFLHKKPSQYTKKSRLLKQPAYPCGECF